MHDQKRLIIHQSQRNLSNLAIVHPVINHGQHRPLKDQRRIDHVDAVFFYALMALGLIPFEFHRVSPYVFQREYTKSVH